MCGIVGYVGERSCRELLLQGLERLEYRGYDSAGLSLLSDGRIESVRAVGNLSRLRAAVDANGSNGAVATELPDATIGIGHTRWATHGSPSERNAHPHPDCTGRVHIVLNGIVENYIELRATLESEGHEFASETDAEVVAHLIEKHLDALGENGSLPEATRRAYLDLRGHYAFVSMCSDDPDVLVGARKECPLVVGVGEHEHFIASAIPAFLRETRRVKMVGNEEVVTLQPGGADFQSASGDPIPRESEVVTWDEDAAEKSGYPTFMLKEIHDQSDAVADTIADRLTRADRVELDDIGLTDSDLARVRRLIVVACGTSYHAGLVGRYAIEEWARLPVEMDIASEYRYRNPVVGPEDLVIGVSQSGETADTLAAMRLARERGAQVLAITNILGSQATREADGVLYTRAGLEIGVAATKTFVAQMATMYLIGLKLAGLRRTLEPDRLERLIADLRSIPHKIDELLSYCEDQVLRIARRHHQQRWFLYLGRHIGLPVCLEGALKLKEISYIPTEAYAAGEMKHGPIALLDQSTPVVCVATDGPILDKVLSNIAEVKTRGAEVIAVATEGAERVADVADETVFVPRTDWILQPILAVIPLQLLAYHIARLRDLNVDQPRNLAKTVTVE